MRIEQRIGRIDRYGQKSEAVAIVNFITPGTVDADIYERCLWRIGVFQHAVGGSEEILGTITQELHDIAESFTLTPEERGQRLQQLADNGIRQSPRRTGTGIKAVRTVRPERAQSVMAGRDRRLRRRTGFPRRHPTLRDELSGRTTGQRRRAPSRRKAAQDAAAQSGGTKPLLEDYKRLPRSIEPIAREWEKWLKGAQPLLPSPSSRKPPPRTRKPFT